MADIQVYEFKVQAEGDMPWDEEGRITITIPYYSTRGFEDAVPGDRATLAMTDGSVYVGEILDVEGEADEGYDMHFWIEGR